MAVEHINETDTLNQGRIKINQIMDQSNAASEKVDTYKAELTAGINDAKQIAADAGENAKQIATDAGNQANEKADQAIADSKTAVQTANQAVGTANQNKQDFDALRNEFDDLVAESGDSNPEIVQARTDTQGIKQSTLQARLTRDFGNRMTTTEAVQMFSGPINTPKMMDFSGKTAGNVATNPHQAFSDYTAATLKKPTDTWNEVSQENYNKLAGRDDSGVSTGSTQNGVIPQQMYKMNVIEAIKTMAPNIFDGNTLEESIQYVKDNFISFTLSLRGKASSPNNKNLKAAIYLENTDSYTTQLQNAAEEYTDFTVEINDNNFIDSNGIINVLVYSDSSNGVTSSNIDVDYVGVQILVSLNPLSVLESSGFIKEETLQKHVDDNTNPHNVTKSQVGLGSVDNYATASQADAEVGTANNLFMTPLRVFQAIAKWVEGKFVSLNGNDTISGTKNFVDGVQVDGKDVASVPDMPLEMYFGQGTDLHDSANNSRATVGSLQAIDNFHTRNDVPFTWNSGGYEATMSRDATLYVNVTMKIQGGNNNNTYSDYVYIFLEHGATTGGTGTKEPLLMIGANGGQALNLQNTLSGKLVVNLKKGDKFAFTAETRTGKKIFTWRFIQGYFKELKPIA